MHLVTRYSLFFLSFAPLWVTLLFIDFKSLFWNKDGSAMELLHSFFCEQTLKGRIGTEILSICAILLGAVISGIALYCLLRSHPDAGTSGSILLLGDAREEKTLTSEYLLGYILPLVAFDFTLWFEVAQFLFFFAVLGFLALRHHSVSCYLVLEFLDYRVYDCELRNNNGYTVRSRVISRHPLTSMRGREILLTALNSDVSLHLRDKESRGES